jgi:hypothetical protein
MITRPRSASFFGPEAKLWRDERRDIGWAEAAAVEFAVRFLLRSFNALGKHLLIRCDNMGVVESWKKWIFGKCAAERDSAANLGDDFGTGPPVIFRIYTDLAEPGRQPLVREKQRGGDGHKSGRLQILGLSSIVILLRKCSNACLWASSPHLSPTASCLASELNRVKAPHYLLFTNQGLHLPHTWQKQRP